MTREEDNAYITVPICIPCHFGLPKNDAAGMLMSCRHPCMEHSTSNPRAMGNVKAPATFKSQKWSWSSAWAAKYDIICDVTVIMTHEVCMDLIDPRVDAWRYLDMRSCLHMQSVSNKQRQSIIYPSMLT